MCEIHFLSAKNVFSDPKKRMIRYIICGYCKITPIKEHTSDLSHSLIFIGRNIIHIIFNLTWNIPYKSIFFYYDLEKKKKKIYKENYLYLLKTLILSRLKEFFNVCVIIIPVYLRSFALVK